MNCPVCQNQMVAVSKPLVAKFWTCKSSDCGATMPFVHWRCSDGSEEKQSTDQCSEKEYKEGAVE